LRSDSTMLCAPTKNAIQASNCLIVTRAVVTALVSTALLSACLLTRLYAFKQQFCDYQDNFSFITGDEFRVNLLKPILLDKDVIWLAGAEPSRQRQDEQSANMQWIVAKVLPAGAVADPEFDQLSIEMDLQADDGKFLLHRVRMDPRFAYVVSPDLMERHAGNVCNSNWLVLGRSGEIDLAGADLSGQPDQQELKEYLGRPTASSRNDEERSLGMRFEYRLLDSDRQEPQYSFEFWHDETTGELLRSTANSVRFSSTTDFVQKKLWVKIR